MSFKIKHLVLSSLLCLFATNAYAFEAKIAVQAFIKSGSVAYTGTHTVRFIINDGSANVWCKDLASVAITSGVLNQSLNGNGSNCGAVGNFSAVAVNTPLEAAVPTNIHVATAIIDVDNNGIGVGTDATYSGIPIAAVPFALSSRAALVKLGAAGTAMNLAGGVQFCSTNLTTGANLTVTGCNILSGNSNSWSCACSINAGSAVQAPATATISYVRPGYTGAGVATANSIGIVYSATLTGAGTGGKVSCICTK
jgi:hypothetical protein